ncbi:hypothetical protein CORC01_06452 [Colletotrichum orchidophilum]|uniref:Uncharacterized protein n=1 Tax=Colletotrichum orchidophilum TaxID=1209926 RepID=A0A1G4BAA2_9PEZI|nr:uncharacterized protein CORC01_06452 [Colletotrichum orchidophilum]OHE98255.1 hypothetical protein CORC01_06452 [Colletotrichum orchidophilum]
MQRQRGETLPLRRTSSRELEEHRGGGAIEDWEICFSGFTLHHFTRGNLPIMNHIIFPSHYTKIKP